MLRSLFHTNNNNNSTVINSTKLCIGKPQFMAFFFCLKIASVYGVNYINYHNNNREHFFFKNQSFSGSRRYCSYVFANRAFHLFLICYNRLHSKIEISLCQLAWITTAICDFLVWPTWKNALFCIRCCIVKLTKIVKPLWFYSFSFIYFLCVCCLNDGRISTCYRLTFVQQFDTICLNKNFPICICFNHNKKICPSSFFISGYAGGLVVKSYLIPYWVFIQAKLYQTAVQKSSDNRGLKWD